MRREGTTGGRDSGRDVASARALTHARNGKGAGGLEPGEQGETCQGFGSPVTTGRVVEALVSRRERCGSHSGDLGRNRRVLSRGVNGSDPQRWKFTLGP